MRKAGKDAKVDEKVALYILPEDCCYYRVCLRERRFLEEYTANSNSYNLLTGHKTVCIIC